VLVPPADRQDDEHEGDERDHAEPSTVGSDIILAGCPAELHAILCLCWRAPG